MAARRSLVLAAGATVLSAVVAGACSSVSGLGDLVFDLPTGAGGATSSSMNASCVSGSGTPSSSSAGGMGGGSVSMSSAGGASSSSSGTLNEDCTNGLDDDMNGFIDCEDPLCKAGGAVCAVPPAGGWQGPVWLATAPAGSAPACPGGANPAFTGLSGIIADPATCSGCTCDAPLCDMQSASFYSDDACTIGLGSVAQVDGVCELVPMLAAVAVQAPAPIASCVAHGGTATKNPPMWMNDIVACPATTGLGCSGGEACFSPTGPFQEICVYRVGNVPCPTGFPVKKTIATQVDDTRGCTKCTCDATPVSCTGKSELYNMAGCPGAGTPVTNDGSCTSIGGAAFASLLGSASASGMCMHGGGSPTGGEVEDTKVNVCCTN